MSVKPIPDGYHSVTPYMIINGAADAIEFYEKAFGAVELSRMAGPDGTVMHAEIKIGDSAIMLADECEAMGALGLKTIGGSPVMMHVYVEDCDAMMEQAIAAGGKEIRPMTDQWYGDRSGMVEDPFGYKWNLSTHKEDLTPEEIAERMPKGEG